MLTPNVPSFQCSDGGFLRAENSGPAGRTFARAASGRMHRRAPSEPGVMHGPQSRGSCASIRSAKSSRSACMRMRTQVAVCGQHAPCATRYSNTGDIPWPPQRPRLRERRVVCRWALQAPRRSDRALEQMCMIAEGSWRALRASPESAARSSRFKKFARDIVASGAAPRRQAMRRCRSGGAAWGPCPRAAVRRCSELLGRALARQGVIPRVVPLTGARLRVQVGPRPCWRLPRTEAAVSSLVRQGG